MKHILIAFMKVYRAVISPLYGQVCKYYPSCSQYAVDAIREHGPWQGFLLASWRLLRCNPLSDGGFDPVPPRRA